MAKPTAAPSTDLVIVVDRETPFRLVTPILRSTTEVLSDRTCDATLCDARDREIHPTLSGYCRSRGDGSYERELSPRALWLHLSERDGERMSFFVNVRGYPSLRVPAVVRVVL